MFRLDKKGTDHSAQTLILYILRKKIFTVRTSVNISIRHPLQRLNYKTRPPGIINAITQIFSLVQYRGLRTEIIAAVLSVQTFLLSLQPVL